VDEVTTAIDAVLPIIEVVETRLLDRESAGPLWALADHQAHGELVHGAPCTEWSDAALAEVKVGLRIGASVTVDRLCRNAGGHPLRLATRLANLAGAHYGGLKAGQIITTGSLTGLDLAPPGSEVHATVDGVGEVHCRFRSL
jgi:2-keto-4-pentenoate hydratase